MHPYNYRQILTQHARIFNPIGDFKSLFHIPTQQLFVEISSSLERAVCSEFQHLLPETVKTSVRKRQHEYILGRLAVAALLLEAGCAFENCWLTTDNRRPVWPRGFVGSISHSNDIVAVAIQRTDTNTDSLGIDVERIIHAIEFQESLIHCFTINEINHLAKLEDGLIFGFSIKEALFKCLNPIVKVFFDFHDAEIVQVNTTNRSMTLVLRRALGSLDQGVNIIGHYRRIRVLKFEQVWAGVWWPNYAAAM